MPILHRFLTWLRANERRWLPAFVMVAVLLPTGFFLWFFWRAMASDNVARRAEAAEIHRNLLNLARAQLEAHIQRRAHFEELTPTEPLPAAQRFLHAVKTATADAVIFLATDGRPLYPALPVYRPAESLLPEEKAALSLRYELRDPSGGFARMLDLMPRILAPELRGLRDADGRHIQPGLILAAHEQMKGHESSRSKLLDGLRAQVLDYTTQPPMASPQRLFLADAITAIDPAFTLPTRQPELLAVRVLQQQPAMPAPAVLTRAEIPADVWMLLSHDGGKLALLTPEKLWPEFRNVLQNAVDNPHYSVRVRLAGASLPEDCIAAIPAGRQMPDWDLQLYTTGEGADQAGERRRLGFLAVGAGALALTGIVGFFAVRRFLAQTHITELRHDFLSTVTHELKTPLTSMRLLVDTLHGGLWADKERVRQYVEIMQREITRLSHLVDSFLTYTRLERGRMHFDFQETAPEEIAAHAISIVEPKFCGAGEFTFEIEPGLPTLMADADTLTTAVLNLLDNAWKYSPENRQVHLSVVRDGNAICFSVKDNGLGLSPRDSKLVLQRYYRVDSFATRGIGGAGLGLSIVKYVAEAHNGSVAIQSELGKGSTFTIRIPTSHSSTP